MDFFAAAKDAMNAASEQASQRVAQAQAGKRLLDDGGPEMEQKIATKAHCRRTTNADTMAVSQISDIAAQYEEAMQELTRALATHHAATHQAATHQAATHHHTMAGTSMQVHPLLRHESTEGHHEMGDHIHHVSEFLQGLLLSRRVLRGVEPGLRRRLEEAESSGRSCTGETSVATDATLEAAPAADAWSARRRPPESCARNSHLLAVTSRCHSPK